jgi:hypothetical protein
MTLPYALGAIASPPDARDYRVEDFLAPRATPLPRSFSYAPLLGAVLDQGQEGTCVGNALVGTVLAFDEATLPASSAPYLRELSRRDAYAGGRELTPLPGEGCVVRSALESARTRGVCIEADRPYTPQHDPGAGPLAPVHRNENRLAGYAAVGLDVAAIKAAMHDRGPLLAALSVRDGFYSPDGVGRVQATGADHGGHAIGLVGWDDDIGAFFLRNSWGVGWGRAGYCWLPYSYPLSEVWSAVPALLPDGTPPPPAQEPWWISFGRFLHIVS